MAYWTSLVSSAQFDELMEATVVNWSTHRLAKRGDKVVFYATGPISAFVATADITRKHPFRKQGRWHHADMDNVKHTSFSYHIREARKDFPQWGWLKTPISSVQIPEEIVPKLLNKFSQPYPAPQAIGRSRASPASDIAVPDDDENPPSRIRLITTRIVRTSRKAALLKELYDSKCQCCDVRLGVPNGDYIEVHHLRPLGHDHGGKDNWDNMIVLCPNCHVRFDLLAIAIDPKSGNARSFSDNNKGQTVRFREHHQVAAENVRYHWNRFRKGR